MSTAHAFPSPECPDLTGRRRDAPPLPAGDPSLRNPPAAEVSGGSQGTTRREFTRTLAALAVAMPLAPEAALALPVLAPNAPTGPATPVDPLPETDALLAIVRHRHGAHLSPDQLEAVRAGIEAGLRAAERLQRARLANGDEPGLGFAAYRAEG